MPREFYDNAASYHCPAWLAGAANDSFPPFVDGNYRPIAVFQSKSPFRSETFSGQTFEEYQYTYS